MLWLFVFFVECIVGLYGKECTLNCSQFCHKKSCYQTTGECVNGCEDGYLGGLCTLCKISVVIYVHWCPNKRDLTNGSDSTNV